jgi:hypothetical protein
MLTVASSSWKGFHLVKETALDLGSSSSSAPLAPSSPSLAALRVEVEAAAAAEEAEPEATQLSCTLSMPGHSQKAKG